MGFKQRLGIDYEQKNSPVMSDVTLRVIICISLRNGWKLIKLDIKNAFLNSELEEILFISLPGGWEEVSSEDEGKIGLLKKALYGLKQASRAFYKEITTKLTSVLSMTQSKTDMYYLSMIRWCADCTWTIY